MELTRTLKNNQKDDMSKGGTKLRLSLVTCVPVATRYGCRSCVITLRNLSTILLGGKRYVYA